MKTATSHFATTAEVSAFKPGDGLVLRHEDGTVLEAVVTTLAGTIHPKISVAGFGTRCVHELRALGWHFIKHTVGSSPEGQKDA